jgi:hypothetical protein
MEGRLNQGYRADAWTRRYLDPIGRVSIYLCRFFAL